MNKKLRRVGVLMGGPSSERDISLKSGWAVYRALKEKGVAVVAIDVRANAKAQVRKADISCAFVALHGKFGEDGTIQKMLESLEIPYTGSGVIASYLCLDKVASRRIFQHYYIPVPEFEVLHRRAKKSRQNISLAFPVVLKPSNQGSSIGVTCVSKRAQFRKALDLAFEYDDTVIVEKYLPGREITVGVLDDTPLPVVEIIPKEKFFNFQAKYEKGKTKYVVPAKLSTGQFKEAQRLGLLAHQVLGCRGFSRADIILSRGTPFVLEVNSIPGLTETSLLPMAAGAIGISFPNLCLKILHSADKS
ncbi:MAG: D-alanine--D-alanine ligase [Candidatus Omnitrophota bacterium]